LESSQLDFFCSIRYLFLLRFRFPGEKKKGLLSV